MREMRRPPQPPPLPLLPTGVPGLDRVLDGGLPEYSFNLIAGEPGAGKTTLAHQIMFANATPERPALYLTVLGEPPIKMLRYQQRMGYFDPGRVGESVFFVDLSDLAIRGDLGAVLDDIVAHVERLSPGLVVVDSFQTVVRKAAAEAGELDLQGFVQRLAVRLAGWEATAFLIGEYGEPGLQDNPAFTVADGIIRLTQVADRNSVVRKLQVVKSRGQAFMPGLHTVRIGGEGLEVFPRILASGTEADRTPPRERLAVGVRGLDALLGGGIPAGNSVLVTGPSGTGKSVLATQFIAEGARRGERGVIAVFEERPREYVRRAQGLGLDLEGMVGRGELEVIYLRPLDLSPDEALQEIRAAVERLDAGRVVIDSLSGFELALAPAFREDFRESLYRLVSALTGTGITVLMTMEIVQSSDGMRFSPNAISFLADDLVLLRYVEIDGSLRKGLSVVKMRGSDHSKELWGYEVTPRGLVVRESLEGYRGITTGVAVPREGGGGGGGVDAYPGLIEREVVALRALLELGEGTAEAIADRTGLELEAVAPALDRLIAIGYAAEAAEDRGTAYHPVAGRR